MRSTKQQYAIAAIFAFGATCAMAGQDNTKSIAVSTTVANKCIVAANSTLPFASYDPVVTNAATPAGDLAASSTFQVRCTKGSTGVEIGMGLGLNASSGGTALPRNMSAGGTDLLLYHLYQPTGANLDGCAGTTVWGDTANPGGNRLAVGSAFWTSSSNKAINICGLIPGAQDVAAGSYTDTVVIDVWF